MTGIYIYESNSEPHMETIFSFIREPYIALPKIQVHLFSCSLLSYLQLMTSKELTYTNFVNFSYVNLQFPIGLFHISEHVWAEALTAFVLNHLFQGCVYRQQS